MQTEAIETIEKDGYTLNIYPDIDPESPREWDNLGTMVCFHRDYNLGDKTEFTEDSFNSWDELYNRLDKEEQAAVILPLYLFDHSGISISTTAYSCAWDSGQVGYIYISRKDILDQYNRKRLSKKLLERVTGYLQGEVKTYNQYLTGDVYGYSIENDQGEVIDSCYGFYGEEDCKAEAMAEFNYQINSKQ